LSAIMLEAAKTNVQLRADVAVDAEVEGHDQWRILASSSLER
jgi:hypothetical protein